ncbi:MAG TPA: hypothetical protein VE733_20845 [Streptosporangiaceae bacterium]|nr:hypothetical protein [Streptosporangiaceae bacterium]
MEVDIRTPAWQIWTVMLAACGFLIPEIFIRPTRGSLIFLNAFAVMMIVFAVAFWRNLIALRGETLTVRGLLAKKTVDLRSLSSVGVLRARGKVQYWKLTFSDRFGRSVSINFDGFRADERDRMLAAIKPWVLRPGIHLQGPVERAMAGQLWWSGGSGKSSRGSARRHDPPRHAGN